MRDLDRFQGCLVGGAVGDALGYAIEFDKEPAIFREYGPEGIRDYKLVGGRAEISDDTQMALFTAAGLLTDRALGTNDPVRAINEAYLDWYQTQQHARFRRPRKTSWLMNVPGLYDRRAPGNTCLDALGAAAWAPRSSPSMTARAAAASCGWPPSACTGGTPARTSPISTGSAPGPRP